MLKSKPLTPSLSLALCLACLIALCFKSLREPDLWWMLHTGNWILEQGQMTYQDPFSYTFPQVDWFNVKWLYEVLIALWAKVFQAEGLFVLQALMSLGMMYFVWRIARLFQPQLQMATALSLAGLAFLALEFRWIARPEMSSHLLSLVFLFLLQQQRQNPSWRIWLLLPLQAIWANLHEAYGTGMVILLAFAGVQTLEYLLWGRKQGDYPPPWSSFGPILLALLAVAIHPRGLAMWTHLFDIYGQLSTNQYTSELYSASDPIYWTLEAYLAMFFALVVVFALLRQTWGQLGAGRGFLAFRPSAIGLPYWVMLGLFFYLALRAHRNLPFFVLPALPIVLHELHWVLTYFRPRLQKFAKLVFPSLSLFYGLFYLSIVSGYYHDWRQSRDRFGLQILTGQNPVGAAQFIENQPSLRGKKALTDYLVSAYLLHRLSPDFKTYIDLRDLDIFSDAFFQRFIRLTFDPQVFEEEDALHNFDYVVLFRPQFTQLHRYLFSREDFDLVFVDAVAAVYVRNKAEHEAILAKHGHKARGGAEVFGLLAEASAGAVPRFLTLLLNPWHGLEDYRRTDQDLIAAAFYRDLGIWDLAQKRAQKATEQGLQPSQAWEVLADVYAGQALSPTTEDSLRPKLSRLALDAYAQALKLSPQAVSALRAQASLLIQQQQYAPALEILERARKTAPKDAQTLQLLALTYKILASQAARPEDAQAYVFQWIKYLELWLGVMPKHVPAELDLGLAYCALGNCQRARPLLEPLLNLPGLSPTDLKVAADCVKSCGGR